MKVREIFEASQSDLEAQGRDMYGSMGHYKAQAHVNSQGGGGGWDSDPNDGYSWKDWANDWFNDLFGNTDELVHLYGKNPEAAYDQFARVAHEDKELDDSDHDTLWDYFEHTIVPNYGRR